ncbi:MAG: adenylate kinase [Lachnospiraceae bacterium]|nr:adenylate kinase [Lachnospiraceae bacterium]
MKIILMGAPGAGKGTHARFLSEKYDIPQIATGDIFRANLREKTPLGLEAKQYMDQGLLVPDELTTNMVLSRLQEEDCRNGYILDGFPRNLNQARALTEALAALGQEIDFVIHLEIEQDVILHRMEGRRVCERCGASYNLKSLPPRVEGVCDYCGGAVVQRPDDAPETVLKRLDVYHEQTAPILDYYRELGKEAQVDSGASIDEVRAALVAILGE